MKINPFQSNISFCYNKEYHDKVIQRLSNSRKNKSVSKVLLDLEKQSLSIEDSIVKLENTPNGVYDNSFNVLVSFLMGIKSTITSYMEKYYPNLHYAKNVTMEYAEEISRCTTAEEQYWRQDLCKMIVSNASHANDTTGITKQNGYTDSYSGIQENRLMENDINPEMNELISEFRPQSNSPRGFVDIVGLEKTKAALQEEIIDYIENPQLRVLDKLEYGIEPCATMLFYGPPGCGKTYITEALAAQSGLRMFKMDISKIGSKYVNETAANIQKAFDYLEQVAKSENKPVLLFMDELDSLAMKRETPTGGSSENLKTTSTLLKLIQEAKDKNIIIIGATNRRNIVDTALLDRFETETYFGLSDENGIRNLLKAKLGKISKGKKLSDDEESLRKISKELYGYSNRSIVHILEKASKIAKRNSRSDITEEIIRLAISECDFEKINEKTYQKDKRKKIGFNL